MSIFKTEHLRLIKRSLDVYQRQHEAISKNVANASNPQFQKVNTDFSHVLKKEIVSNLKVSDQRHMSGNQPVSPGRHPDKSGPVEVAAEMGDLAVNQVKFDFAARVLRRVYDGLTTAIIGRNR